MDNVSDILQNFQLFVPVQNQEITIFAVRWNIIAYNFYDISDS